MNIATVGKALGAEALRWAAPTLCRSAGPILASLGTGLEKVGGLCHLPTGAMTDGAIRIATGTALRVYQDSNDVEMTQLNSRNVNVRKSSMKGPKKAPTTTRVLDSSQMRTVNRKKVFAAALVIGQIVAGVSLIALAVAGIATSSVIGAPVVVPFFAWLGLALFLNSFFSSHLEESFNMDKLTDSNKMDALKFALALPAASLLVFERWLTNPNASSLAEAHRNN